MIARGVLWSANDYIIYSLYHDRPPRIKPLRDFEVGRLDDKVPPPCHDWLPTYHRPTYSLTADHLNQRFAICRDITGDYVSPAGQPYGSVVFFAGLTLL
eukprot:2743912-Pleurochrysis_carterae.AAC.1